MSVKFNNSTNTFYYVSKEGTDYGVVNREALRLIDAHRVAFGLYAAKVASLDFLGYDHTPQEAGELAAADHAEEIAALRCVQYAVSHVATTGDAFAIDDYAKAFGQKHGIWTMRDALNLPKRFGQALCDAALPPSGQTPELTAAIAAWAEASIQSDTASELMMADVGNKAQADAADDAGHREYECTDALFTLPCQTPGDVLGKLRHIAACPALLGYIETSADAPRDLIMSLLAFAQPQPALAELIERSRTASDAFDNSAAAGITDEDSPEYKKLEKASSDAFAAVIDAPALTLNDIRLKAAFLTEKHNRDRFDAERAARVFASFLTAA